MKIAGILPTSLQDYPGQIAAVVFTSGCNFSCPYCHNPELVSGGGDNFYDEEYVISMLADRKNYLDGVVITGGEPTLQGDLVEFLSRLKDEDYLIKLDTNGSRPQVLAKLLQEELIDYVAWDYKLPAGRYDELTEVENIKKRLEKTAGLLAESNIEVEIRTTVVPELMSGEDIAEITRELARFNNGEEEFPDRYFLQEFRGKKVLNPQYSEYTPFTREKMQEFLEKARINLNREAVELRENY